MDRRRRTLLGAAALGAAMSAATILGFSGGDVSRMTLSDGLISRYIAANLNADPADVDAVVVKRGTSLRYGRIGLSAAIWLLSAGREPAMPYVQPLIMILCAAAVTAAVRALAPRAPPPAILAPFLALGFLLSVAAGFQDALAVACGVWAVVFAVRERWWASAGMLAAALLTRENAGAVLLGLAIWCVLRRTYRPIPILFTSLAPVAVWHTYVWTRYGHLPVLDPYLRVSTSTIRPPLLAVWQSLTRTAPDSVMVLLVHLALAGVAFGLWRRSVLGTVAAASALQVLMAGPFSWHYIGEAVRAFSFLQTFVVLASVARRFGDEPVEAPGGVMRSASPSRINP